MVPHSRVWHSTHLSLFALWIMIIPEHMFANGCLIASVLAMSPGVLRSALVWFGPCYLSTYDHIGGWPSTDHIWTGNNTEILSTGVRDHPHRIRHCVTPAGIQALRNTRKQLDFIFPRRICGFEDGFMFKRKFKPASPTSYNWSIENWNSTKSTSCCETSKYFITHSE